MDAVRSEAALTPRTRRRRQVAAGVLALSSGLAMSGVWVLDSSRTTVLVDVFGLGWGLCVVLLAVIGGICGVAAMALGASLLLRERALLARLLGGLIVVAAVASGGITAALGLWLGAWASGDYWWDLGTTRDGRHLVVEEQGFFHPWAQLAELHGLTVTLLPDTTPLPDDAAPLGGDVHLSDGGSRLRWTGDAGGVVVDTDAAR